MAIGSYITRDPLTIPPLARAWFDFSDQATITSSSNNASSVKDKAGTIYSLSQGTTINQPKTGTRTHNGLNVLDFDGNDFMQFNLNTAVSSPFTIFIIGQYDTSSTQQSLIGRQTSAIAGQFVIRKEVNSTTFNSFLFGSGGQSSSAVIPQAVGNLNPNIHQVNFSGVGSSAINYSLNGSAAYVGANINGYDNTVATSLVIGSNSNTSGSLDGWIGEIIIYDRVLTSDQILFINRYLSKKWGVALV